MYKVVFNCIQLYTTEHQQVKQNKHCNFAPALPNKTRCIMITFENLPTAVTTLLKEVGELKELFLNQNSQTLPTPEALLTIQQASEFLNLSVPTIYSKVSKGELPVMKQGKRLYFSSIELMQFIKDGRIKTNAEIEAEAVDYLNKNKGGKKC